MKRILFMLLMLPLMGMAQVNDAKYLAKDAVPVENGHVIYKHEIELPGSSVDAIYTAVQEWMNGQFAPMKELPNHKIISIDQDTYEATAGGEEWLVFSNKFFALDRTRMYYRLKITCYDQKIVAQIYDIRYWYDEERDGGVKYSAEEWITNEWAVNKKGTKLSKKSGKFRRMTIDRMEEIFGNMDTYLKQHTAKYKAE